MEKLWGKFNQNQEVASDIDILQSVYFSPFKTIGEIREQFDSWSLTELESLALEIYFTYVDDDGDEEKHFGQLHPETYTGFSEAANTISMPTSIWKACNKKKKFF
ncbi:hypothetical protein [Viridibacillus arvi]|uniref:hypothetical protein n=1 Tax=Viridibacillus arvi TaxID=263475 RepID=UPI0034CFA1F6